MSISTIVKNPVIDGYTIDLSAGATTNQVLQYDGTKFKAATVSSGAGASEYGFTLKNYYDNLAINKAAGSSNEVHGTQFYFTTAATITGANFYWGDATSKTVRVKLWAADGGTLLKTVDVAVNGVGWYTATFASSYSAPAWTSYVISHWETSGALSWKWNMRGVTTNAGPPNNMDPFGWNGTQGNAPPAPWQAGAHFFWQSWALWATGDVIPVTNAGTERYAIEPVFTVP